MSRFFQHLVRVDVLFGSLEGLAKGGVQACADPDIRQLLRVVAALHQIVDAVGYAI